jgi:hypothetical protein
MTGPTGRLTAPDHGAHKNGYIVAGPNSNLATTALLEEARA